MAEMLEQAKKLKLIQHQGVGYDSTDVAAAKRLGIPVDLTPEGTTIGVAERDNPLFELDNVVLTPHIAAETRDALVAKMQAIFANIQRVTRGEDPINLVS